MRAEIEKRSAQFSQFVQTLNAAGLASLYHAEGRLFPPGSTAITGPEAIQSFFAGMFANGITGGTFTPADIRTEEMLAVETGRYSLSAGGQVAAEGAYLYTWQRVEGEWFLLYDMWN